MTDELRGDVRVFLYKDGFASIDGELQMSAFGPGALQTITKKLLASGTTRIRNCIWTAATGVLTGFCCVTPPPTESNHETASPSRHPAQVRAGKAPPREGGSQTSQASSAEQT
jgi:hypothetical protein